MSVLLEQDYFKKISKAAFSLLQKSEHLFLGFDAESTQFIRINRAKVRQAGEVSDAILNLVFVLEKSQSRSRATRTLSLCGNFELDQKKIAAQIISLRDECGALPADPYAELPKPGSSNATEKKGDLLSPMDAFDALLSKASDIDLVGIFSSGPIVRAMSNSAGLEYWFKTESFLFDYSLFTPNQRALKDLFGGQKWNRSEYESRIAENKKRLELLEKAPRKLSPGEYRVYLAPHAISDIVNMFSWGCVGEAALRQGDSPLRRMRSGEKNLSLQFNLSEDFRGGEVPRWNDEGELAPEFLEIISEGSLKNTLVSKRTANEYKIPSNAALPGEGLRSPVVRPGNLSEKSVLDKLCDGIFISNLHYLNWSDQPEGRITGMTRYACLWVENGKIQGPIENMRFDDSIFRIFGTELEAVSDRADWIPDSGTYGMRALGSQKIPGMLISKMKFTF